MAATTVTYEVYAREGNARWVVKGRYGRGEREEAVAHAKSIERLKRMPVRVVRETYWAANDHVEEVTVYRSESRLTAERPAAAAKAPANDDAPARKPAAETKSSPIEAKLPPIEPVGTERKKALSQALRTFGKAVGVVVAAVLLGLVVTSALSSLIDDYGGSTLTANKTTILGTSYIAIVLLTALPLLFKLLGIGTDGGQKEASPARRSAKPAETAPVKAEKEEAPPEKTPPPAAPAKKERVLVSLGPVVVDQPVNEENGEAAETAAEDSGADDKEAEDEPLPPLTAEQQFAELAGLLPAVLRGRWQSPDQHKVFGAALLLAGAVRHLRRQGGDGSEGLDDMLASALKEIGIPAALAGSFADKLEDYADQPRYRPMVGAGHVLIDGIAKRRSADPSEILRCLEAWTAPATAETDDDRMIAVLVSALQPRGETGLSEDGGATLAQLHERMLRRALVTFAGTVVTVTAEQVVARFEWPAQAIEAAMAVQEAVARHNDETPDEAFDVRIGIDAAIVPAEAPELIAPAVATASRAAQTAQPAQILCTRGIREGAPADAFTFTAMEEGTDPAEALSLVVWQKA